jgi:hypothetical protein
MSKTIKISSIDDLKKLASKIKVNPRLDNIEDAPFFKKKMEKGTKILAIAGLPK